MNVVCGVLKLYFRELPEPLVPTELFHRLALMLGKITPPPHPTPERPAVLCSGNTLCQRTEPFGYFFFLLWAAVNSQARSV